MRLIDEQYQRTPFYGWPRMTAYLRRQGYEVNHKRVQRLMGLMGLQAVYPKPRASAVGKGHKVYPYLLRNLAITQSNQVWSGDITYILGVALLLRVRYTLFAQQGGGRLPAASEFHFSWPFRGLDNGINLTVPATSRQDLAG